MRVIYILALLVAVAAARPAVFDIARPVDESVCSLLGPTPYGVSLGLADPRTADKCCDACMHPYLLYTERVETSLVARESLLSKLERYKAAGTVTTAGSGAGTTTVESETLLAVTSFVHDASVTISEFCGKCIEMSECEKIGGRIQIWHHRCIV